jgi:cell division septal protein FtsQ
MAKQERPRQRALPRQNSKVPLTFYRGRESSTASESPFKNKEQPGPSRLSRFFARLLDGVIIVALLACLLYSLFVKDTPKVTLNSEIYHSRSAYEAAAHKYLSTLTNRNKITLNEEAIINSLQAEFPEISSASVELPILAETPVIHINIANPSFILSSSGSSYIVSSDGVAIDPAGKLQNSKNLTIVTDQSGFNTKAGERVMSASSVQFINSLIAQMKHANIGIGQLVLPPLAQELDLKTSDKPYFVKFYLGGDVQQQAGQFLASRHQFDSTNTQPTQYLDVRVPGKVFYK